MNGYEKSCMTCINLNDQYTMSLPECKKGIQMITFKPFGCKKHDFGNGVKAILYYERRRG